MRPTTRLLLLSAATLALAFLPGSFANAQAAVTPDTTAGNPQLDSTHDLRGFQGVFDNFLPAWREGFDSEAAAPGEEAEQGEDEARQDEHHGSLEDVAAGAGASDSAN
jgi:hypothetical protein